MSAHLASLLHALGCPRVLVVGDLMLDHYVFGTVDRISPEAPIQVLKVERDEHKPGGAGSVASMLGKLEAEVALVSAVGEDQAGDRLLEELARVGCDTSGVVRVAGRETTQKTRMIAGVQHVLRVDREETGPFAPDVERELAAQVARLLPGCDIAIVSDYNKGLLRGGLVAEVARRARAAGKEVILDPKKEPDYSLYRGVTAITPNRAETQLATGIAPRDPGSCAAAGRKLVEELGLEAAIITLDKDGIWLEPREGEGRRFPTQARSVYDVTGAGDMVISMIGLARASGLDWGHAIELANVAAGVEITRVGVAPLSRREILNAILERDNAFVEKIVGLETFVADTLPELRRKRKKIAFTNGCFDLLHVGHVKLLQFARAQADVLVVGLNSDRSTREIKGPGRPIIAEEDRAALLAALAAVDHVIVFDEPTPLALIEAIVPDVLVKAADYEGKVVVGRQIVEAAGGRVALAPLVGGVSTTGLLRRLGAVGVDDAAAAAARAAAEQVYARTESDAKPESRRSKVESRASSGENDGRQPAAADGRG